MKRSQRFVHDGFTIPVEVWGVGTRPLIFLPGMGVHPRYYAEGLGRLASQFTVFVPDLSFRTHDTLPDRIHRYLDLTEAFAARFAPDAPRAGHSFGGFLALLGTSPAVALSPTVPIRVGWTAKVGRAARLQFREYIGLEGRRGVCWAWNIFRDYLRTATRRPHCLFPAVSETLRSVDDRFSPSAPSAHVVLATYDSLYRRREYEAYLATASTPGLVVRQVRRGHDWPVTDPTLFEREISRSVRRLLRGSG